MGFKPSPYNATRAFAWAVEMMRGDRWDPLNPLHWDQVRVNLPGNEEYTPTLPWVSKVVGQSTCERIAGDFFMYIDDIRTCDQSEQQCWDVARKVASICGHLGIQDAPWKRRAPSQTPGAWAGSSVVITPEGVAVTVTQEKWDKAKNMVTKWKNRVDQNEKCNRKELESDVGYLIYVTRTFPAMKPYLKGFHLTLHGWREGRTDTGWRDSSWGIGRDTEDWFESEEQGAEFDVRLGEPEVVKPVPRFADDLGALCTLTNGVTPPLRLVRPNRVSSVCYGFGDASGSGFGSTYSNAGEIVYRHGVWGLDDEGRSSNWRELTNLVESLELEARESRLQGWEMFLFMDNSTAESAFFRGTSLSERLFLLVLRLRKLEVEERCLLHLVHVAGTRMIGQGSGGLSRGN